MIIEGNGIKLSASIAGNKLRFQVLEQSDEATAALVETGKIVDEASGFGIKSKNYPSLNRQEKNFYLRGIDKTKNNVVVEKEFDSAGAARDALFTLDALIQKVKKPERMKPDPGNTTHVRQAILTAQQARTLQLSANKHYPEKREWPGAIPPRLTKNNHYNEHQAQVIDVLNKASGKPVAIKVEHSNTDKVDSAGCAYALKVVRALFDNAEANGEGSLRAVWRLVTGLRSPDSENHDPATDRKKAEDRERTE
jgi:hypothetical protein